MTSFRHLLQLELARRCQANPSYSLRAFARQLEIEPSSLSQIITGKRTLSPELMTRLLADLGANEATSKACLRELAIAKRREAIEKSHRDDDHLFELIAEDSFAVMKDWYHYALMEMTYVQPLPPDFELISRCLGISPEEAQLATERLLRMGLLVIENGYLRKTNALITNGRSGDTGEALKELQRQILTKALNAIDSTPAEDKDITSITMPVDVSKLPKAREMIKNFRRDLCAYLGTGDRSRVYNLAVQLFPVSEKAIKTEEEAG